MTVRTPRSLNAATELLERFATVDASIAKVEAVRSAEIVAANASADAEAAPLLAERAEIVAALAPWWNEAGPGLTDGKRKSIEQGGCLVGTRAGRESLGIAGDEDDLVKALQKRTWGWELLRTKISIDKRAVLLSIDGAHKKQLRELGFSRVAARETFFIERTEQSGTLASVAP